MATSVTAVLTMTVMAVVVMADTGPGVRHHRIAVRPSADEVLELLRRTSGVQGIRGALRVPSSLTRAGRRGGLTVRDQTDRWLRRADEMDERFAMAVFKHLDGLLESYCAAVAAGPAATVATSVAAVDAAGAVDFCALAFLLDVGRSPVDGPLSVAFFLQTAARTSPDDLLSQSRRFLSRHYGRDAAAPTPGARSQAATLSDARREIAAASRLFCEPRAFAIADNDFFDPAAVARARRLVAADPFVERAFRTREFYVVFDRVEEGIQTQRDRIIKINYYRTLASPEYENIINESDNQIIQRGWIEKLAFVLFEKDAVRMSDIRSDRLDVRVFTLATLKDRLVNGYAYYLNVVQYYNAVSKVLVLVSIEQGNTLLGGISNVFATLCVHRAAMPFAEIDTARTRLLAFKSSLDRLVDLIAEKLRVDVTDGTKTAFDRRVAKTLSFLSSLRNPKFVRRICLNDNDLFDFVQETKIVGRDDTPAGRTFEEYCFLEPTLNVNKMYAFVGTFFRTVL